MTSAQAPEKKYPKKYPVKEADKEPKENNGAFSFQAFSYGMTAVLIAYLATGAWLYLNADKTRAHLQQRLAVETVQITHNIQKALFDYPRLPAPVIPPPALIETPPQQLAVTQTPSVSTTPIQPKAEITPAAPVTVTGPLAPAPADGLYENTADGKLPKISASGQSPFDAYKRPFTYQGKPVIALAIIDFGLSKADSDAAITALPPEATLIVTPYSDDPQSWQDKARAAGHETWLYVPLENARYPDEDLGPKTLLARAGINENLSRLNWSLGRAAGYAGIVAESDSIFQDMHAMLEQILKYVFGRGIGYAELNPQGSEFIETLATGLHAPFVSPRLLSGVYDPAAFAAIEKAAQENGYAAVTITATPKNLEAATTWTVSLGGKGFSLAPLSALAAMDITAKPAVDAPPTASTAPPASEVKKP